MPPRHVVECPGAGRPFQAWFSVAQRQLLLGWANPITQGYPGLLGITRDYPGIPTIFFTHFFCASFFTSIRELVGAILGPSWAPFGRVLEAKSDASIDIDQNDKIAFSLRRGSKNEGFETPKKPQKIDAAASSKQLTKMQPNFVAK